MNLLPDWLAVSLHPLPVSPFNVSLAIATVLFAGMVRGFVGFGSSLMIVMILSAIFGPPAAVAIAGLSGVPATFQLLPAAVRHAERAFVIPFGLAAFAIAPIGTLILVAADPTVMKITISLFVLLMTLLLYANWRPRWLHRTETVVTAGVASGLIQGATGSGGPPAVAIALARGGQPDLQRANVIGAVSSLSLCGLPPLWYNGLFTTEVLVTALVIAPFYSLTTWLGARFFSGQGKQHYRNAALCALAFISCTTLALAIYQRFAVTG